MTTQEALAKSTGWFQTDGLIGYLPFTTANFLVGTGKYSFESCCCWGDTIKAKADRGGGEG